MSEAREKAKEARALIAKNIDPREHAIEQAQIAEEKCVEAERQRREHSRQSERTIARMFDVYIEKMKESGKTSWREVERCLTRDAIPYIGDKPANEVAPDDISELIARLIGRGAKVQANRLHSYLKAAFNAGIKHDASPAARGSDIRFNIIVNPVDKVERDTNAENVDDRELSFTELKELWNYQGDAISARNLLMLKLIILMGGTRPGEISGAKIDEIDLENRLWSFPPLRIKNRRWHLLPITDLAANLIKEAIEQTNRRDVYLFPNRDSRDRPINSSTLPHSVEDFCRVAEFERFQPKDLRRTVKTRMGEISIVKFIRDVIQNHARTDVSSKHYDRWEYLPEKREALEKWAEYLERIVASENVIPLRNVRARITHSS